MTTEMIPAANDLPRCGTCHRAAHHPASTGHGHPYQAPPGWRVWRAGLAWRAARNDEHTCHGGPLCEAMTMWIETEGETECCEHQSCLEWAHEFCVACFAEDMAAYDAERATG